ncbi:hypothetical protein CDAR_171931 [Caerostris darwini]|uniref:Uncharacterized protein n=1 Tax=Caerostris darwini TaxID=1538125 RepID=A0AAV4UI87_9ARAC|nr:hypothetical protein CDAR_171931 [Caerostris darwini]
MLQEEMDCASAEGAGPFHDHPRTQPDVHLEMIPNLTQPQINCEGLRRTTALLNKATSDLAMTIKYWKDLGDNSDTELDKTMERKIKELTNQKKELEKQVRAYGPCPIELCMYHHNNKKVKLVDDSQFKFPA